MTDPDPRSRGQSSKDPELEAQQRIESALEASEARFAVLADSAPDLIIEVLPRDGVVTYASPNHLQHLGLVAEEMEGTNPMDRIHADDREGVLDNMRNLSQNDGQHRSVFRFRHEDGRWIWFESIGKSYRGSDGKRRVISIARDITDRMDQEARNRLADQMESEARYRELEGKLALETQIADLSRRFLDLATDEIADEIQDNLASVGELADADRAYLLTIDLDRRRLDGLFEWFAPEIETQRGIESGIRLIQDRTGNDEILDRWSVKKLLRGEILHFPTLDHLPEAAFDERRSLEDRGAVSVLSIPVRSGRDFIGIFGLEQITTEKKWSDETIVLLGLVGQIFMSALRRKRAEDALHESQNQLIQSQKMEAMGRLAGGIAHDFNNMLMVISGCAESLLRETSPGQTAYTDLTEIEEAARRAASLSQQLLAFGRRQPYLPTRLNLNDVVESLRGMLTRVIGEEFELRTSPGSELDTILSDAGQIEQIIVNLAVNARDAMRGGGHLTISTSNREFDIDRARKLGLSASGSYVELSVSDTGSGIEDEILTNIFEPFFTTKDVGQGTGLGLAIVYGIVQQNNGSIRVESEIGTGSVFRIWFPSVQEATESESTAAPSVVPSGDETILLVEDESALRRLVGRVLRSRGYEVLEAENGLRGLEIAAEFDGPIHLVVTDLVMPGLGGLEMALQLRSLRPESAFLFVSGYADERVGRPTAEIPGAKMLQKPFTMDILAHEVRDLISDSNGSH